MGPPKEVRPRRVEAPSTSSRDPSRSPRGAPPPRASSTVVLSDLAAEGGDHQQPSRRCHERIPRDPAVTPRRIVLAALAVATVVATARTPVEGQVLIASRPHSGLVVTP